MKKLVTLTLLLLLSFSCKKEKRKDLTEEKIEISSDAQKINKKMFTFLSENNNVTKESFEEFYKIFQKEYHYTKEKSKYNAIVNLIKKALNETDLNIKNKQYLDIKEELLKIK